MANIQGTEGKDTLEGTQDDDVIDAKGGNDYIYATPGRDIVHGGDGVDVLHFAGGSSRYFESYEGPVTYTISDGHFIDSLGVSDLTFDGIEHFAMDPFNTGPVTVDASGWGQSANPGGDLNISVSGNSRVIGSNFRDSIFAGGLGTYVDAGAGVDYVFATPPNGHPGTFYIVTTGDVTHISQNSNTNGEQTLSLDIVNAEYVGMTAQTNTYFENVIDASGSGVNLYFFDGAGRDNVIGSPNDDLFTNFKREYAPYWDDTDTFTGGAGADEYLFTNAIRSLDKTFVTDFSTEDLIDLNSNATAGYLVTTFIGTTAFSGTAGEYRFEISSGHTLIQYDGNGDGTSDGTLTLLNGEFELRQVATGYGPHGLMIATRGPSEADDVVVGTEGNDILLGYGGDDTLKGLDGDDALHGGTGADALIGGLGIDTASYTDDDGGVFVNLTLGRGYANASFGDTYDSVENVIGTNYDDFLIGDPGANRLDGGAGNDTIIGAVGPDILIGGSGTDLLSYEDNSGTVFVNLLTGMGYNNAAQGDTYSGFENVIGGLFDDTLIGDDGANRLDGAKGADELVGNGGADVFVFAQAPGSASGFDHPNSNANRDTIWDFTSGEDRIEINSIAFGGGLSAGMLAESQFVTGDGAGDADDRFIYDQANGRLYFDADGSSGGAQLLIAILPNHDPVAASDFVIV